ncbi:MAG: twin-arginine translocase subunit TatB [Gammaproteobacteria bacterium]|nr:twin-arginine translocase subunit TatB [Gammaproteobacteria bacterium]
MFDVGFWEVLFILILALVVIGPERLPGAARQAGLFIGKARRYIEGVRSEVESELDISEFKRILHNQETQINELQNRIRTSVDDVVKIDAEPSISSTDTLSDTPSIAEASTDNTSAVSAESSSVKHIDEATTSADNKNSLNK